ncbi:MAG TPA: glycosyl hydrolase family 28-related protein [Candidatus Koribacter sp.]|jgi:hypothetical protein
MKMRSGWLFGWFLGWVILVLAVRVWAVGVQTSVVQDVVYRADGKASQGELVIAWPAFVTADGAAVAAGSTTVNLGSDGSFAVSLAPNAGATPANSFYSVTYKLTGQMTSKEAWVVPAAGPATIAQVRATVVPQQMAVQAMTSDWANANLVTLSGAQTIAGQKAFAMAPSVPDPVNASDAVNKKYVDANAGGGAVPADVAKVDAVNSWTQGQTAPAWVSATTPRADVRAFGAKWDGVTDDTAAIQAAIASVAGTGNCVYLPPGTGKITRALTIAASNTCIEGSGEFLEPATPGSYPAKGSRLLTTSTTADVIYIQAPSGGALYNVALRNFGVTGSQSAGGTTGHGIDIDATVGTIWNMELRNLAVNFAAQDAIHFAGEMTTTGSGNQGTAFQIRMDHITMRKNGRYDLYASGWIEQIYATQLYFGTSGSDLLHLAGGTYNGQGLLKAIRMDGISFEPAGGWEIYLDHVTQSSFENAYLSSGSGTGNVYLASTFAIELKGAAGISGSTGSGYNIEFDGSYNNDITIDVPNWENGSSHKMLTYNAGTLFNVRLGCYHYACFSPSSWDGNALPDATQVHYVGNSFAGQMFNLSTHGDFRGQVNASGASYNVTPTDTTVFCTAGTETVNLPGTPTAGPGNEGQRLTLVNNTTATCTVNGNGHQVNGASTMTLAASAGGSQGTTATIEWSQYNGAWFLLSANTAAASANGTMLPQKAVNANYTVLPGDGVLAVYGSSGVTVTLEGAPADGRTVTVVNETSQPVTVNSAGGMKIGGCCATSFTLPAGPGSGTTATYSSVGLSFSSFTGAWGIVALDVPVAAGNPPANKVACWKNQWQQGWCSTQPDATGACTCN